MEWIRALSVCSSLTTRKQDGLTQTGGLFWQMSDVRQTPFSSHLITRLRGVTRKCARSRALEVLMKWITSEPFGMLQPCHQHGRPDSPAIVCLKDNIVTCRHGHST